MVINFENDPPEIKCIKNSLLEKIAKECIQHGLAMEPTGFLTVPEFIKGKLREKYLGKILETSESVVANFNRYYIPTIRKLTCSLYRITLE